MFWVNIEHLTGSVERLWPTSVIILPIFISNINAVPNAVPTTNNALSELYIYI